MDFNVTLILGQMVLGVVNGVFYALLSLGLSIIFGMLGVINFAHGAFFMVGAFLSWVLLEYLGIGYWAALVLVPLMVGAVGMAMERTLIRPLYSLDHLYGLLLTLGLTLALEAGARLLFGAQGMPYAVPDSLRGAVSLGFMFLPTYRVWVVVIGVTICLITWFLIERTPLGAKLRAATEDPAMVQTFGVNVPRMLTLTYGAGIGLAALGGVLAAPIYSVDPFMGTNVVIVVFAVVVIGGMGSVMGSIVTGLAVGILEGLAKAVFPEIASTAVFILMAIVLLARPNGLFGKV
ncbi:branched-chain amino acid ABC transporter permease [Oceanicola sp. 502str15]|uniref:branched-chain amino acid ABC transporter permease n=1 Tax=Oceanicola sp. 502str15 TaxID=2696061 RepID=UPI002094A907|nr:branched-chain amino acid ABC transporter permease [Oceanicola sp. 502str15]MCO6385300.1 branched-chain amino acid ABC transporter permease [Oceanicola sp. 502str15]